MDRVNMRLNIDKLMWVKFLLFTNLITLSMLLFVLKNGGYMHKLKVKIGMTEESVKSDYWAVKGWENTLKQLDYKADIAFFGNSITYYGNFQEAYADKKVVNLGYPGDNIDGMMRRIETLKAVNPDKVFLMAGINGLKNMELEIFDRKYNLLVDSVRKALPQAQIYLQSILPVSKNREKDYGANTKIMKFNSLIERIAQEKRCTYIDLHSLYVEDGGMPDLLTKDGIHLCDKAYDRWYEEEERYIYDN